MASALIRLAGGSGQGERQRRLAMAVGPVMTMTRCSAWQAK
jgi:hypothetical protein